MQTNAFEVYYLAVCGDCEIELDEYNDNSRYVSTAFHAFCAAHCHHTGYYLQQHDSSDRRGESNCNAGHTTQQPLKKAGLTETEQQRRAKSKRAGDVDQ
jgi:protein-arginine kinase activator protein McsA